MQHFRICPDRMLFTLIAFAILSACGDSPDPPSFTGNRLVRSDSPKPSTMEAALLATLFLSDRGCVQARTASNTPVTPIWPMGYRAQGDASSFAIYDGNGNLVARSGNPLTIGGGGANSFDSRWSDRDCSAGGLWLVGDVGGP